MANEWTERDVHRLMHENTQPDGTVRLHDVKKQFRLNSTKLLIRFDNAVSTFVPRE